jgi:hypothetical protein
MKVRIRFVNMQSMVTSRGLAAALCRMVMARRFAAGAGELRA